jgi:hypothetical protein
VVGDRAAACRERPLERLRDQEEQAVEHLPRIGPVVVRDEGAVVRDTGEIRGRPPGSRR